MPPYKHEFCTAGADRRIAPECSTWTLNTAPAAGVIPQMPRACRIACLLAAASACTPGPQSSPPPPVEVEAKPSAEPPKNEGLEAYPEGAELRGTIVGEGPIGDGRCVQKSYEVQLDAEAGTVWIHFENCGGGPSPVGAGLEGLRVGGRYSFEVKRGASPNFGDDPILIAAVPEAAPGPTDAPRVSAQGPIVLPPKWIACSQASDCTVAALGCCHEVAVRRDHLSDATEALEASGRAFCPVKSACGPGADGTWIGQPARCESSVCVLPDGL